jgi:hypothetical protein
MTKELEFCKYEGWKNQPTWVVALVIDNDRESYCYYRGLAEQCSEYHDLEYEISDSITAFTRGSTAECIKAHQDIVDSWLTYMIGRANWDLVHDTIAGRKVKRETDELDELIIPIMRTAPWQDIVAGRKYRFDADNALRDWLWEQKDTWIKTRSIRGTQLSDFYRKLCRICVKVVDWQELYEHFRRD